MNQRIGLILVILCVAGCLKTRSELEAESSGQQQQQQTVVQQKAEVKEKAPPSAYRFEEFDEQMRSLTGRVDSLENSLQQAKNNKQADRELEGKEKQAIEQKLLVYEDALKKLEAQVNAQNEEIARLKAPPVEAAAPAASSKNKNASYDVGEEQFTAKKWKDAIVNFQKYRDQNPKGKNYPDATYKIGVCFQELGMKDDAKAFLEEVTTKYPNSKEAKKAAFRLKSLK